jgi:hypothetical protein
MMEAAVTENRASERGAISIKMILILLLLAATVVVVVKVVPVYVEQRAVLFDVDEIARIAYVRNFNEDKIKLELEKIRAKNDLPAESLTLVGREGTVKVQVSYSRTVNLLVTQYVWRVDSAIVGKSL